eukprot:CAMPEP_0197040362 /NCGR_PEP_ID=MMETSP1384-20130603/17081_1 /TAXON_ID=29189 /ORGANISM="Ammonia sp." /LENGTH=559 /DNA_ID=CAMNT_0042471105 /DNA_START=15 /DNA_END=1694 /DNA_ORIENTATION=-
MASNNTKEEGDNKGSLQQFISDNKLTIATVIACGVLAYYAFKSKRPSFAVQDTKQCCDHNNKMKVVERMEEKKDECGACDNNIEYATPMDAYRNGRREKLLYTTATRTDNEDAPDATDMIAVVDVDPNSPTYCQIISQVNVGKGEEVHHSGWNACASCYGMAGFNRKYLVVPAFTSGNIHFIDVSNARKPRLHKTVSGAMIKEKYGLSYPHTTHCLANGKIMVSFLGVDAKHEQNKVNNGADFLWIDENLQVESRWVKHAEQRPTYGYDYWYQPYHNVMISTEWGTPKAFSTGFNPAHVQKKMYGNAIHIWDWSEHTLIKKITFDESEVCMPLEIRFLHEPKSGDAFCGAALTSNIIHIYKDSKTKEWTANADYIQVEAIEMANWALPAMPGLVTDVLLSMDDKYMYFSNWLHGDIRQYDISDPLHPRLNSRCFVGGSLRADSGFKIKDTSKNPVPSVPKVKGKRIEGGPQMLQLSLDGKRLYVTNSLFTAYDKQFYPDMVRNGGQMLRVDIDLDNGGQMKLNTDFLVDFANCAGGPARPHEMRYPGGDCTSDIFLVQQ